MVPPFCCVGIPVENTPFTNNAVTKDVNYNYNIYTDRAPKGKEAEPAVALTYIGYGLAHVIRSSCYDWLMVE